MHPVSLADIFGKHLQAFPKHGSEKRGPPTNYLRKHNLGAFANLQRKIFGTLRDFKQ